MVNNTHICNYWTRRQAVNLKLKIQLFILFQTTALDISGKNVFITRFIHPQNPPVELLPVDYEQLRGDELLHCMVRLYSHPSIHLSVHLSIQPPIHPPIHSSVHPFIRPSTHSSIYQSIYHL